MWKSGIIRKTEIVIDPDRPLFTEPYDIVHRRMLLLETLEHGA